MKHFKRLWASSLNQALHLGELAVMAFRREGRINKIALEFAKELADLIFQTKKCLFTSMMTSRGNLS